MRQDPDVILVGEMRDHETVEAALAAAETGHLVLSTLHTTDARRDRSTASSTSSRRTSRSRSASRSPARCAASSASASCRAPTARAACRRLEVCVNTGRIADAIVDPDKTGVTRSTLIAEGEYYGMQTFDQALYRAVTDGKVTMRDALRIASRPHDLELLIGTGGHTSTNIDDLDRYSPAEQPG